MAHDHMDEMLEVPEGETAPTIALELLEDPKKGWNVHITTTGHRLAPEHASTEAVWGEGHMHIYVDGIKQGRVYGEWHYLDALDPGEHEVRVELSANDHRPLAVDGDIIDAIVVIAEPEPMEGMSHMHDMYEVPEGETAPTIALDVLEDPKSGWNLHVTTTGFDLVPEKASTEAVFGEGHMHLYVDGQKITRLYADWFHLGALDPGEHQVRVELSANDHSPYAVDGTLIDVTVPVIVVGEIAEPDRVVEIEVTGDFRADRTEVAVGEVVLIRVTADETDQIHVHGYDVYGEVMPGMPAEVRFTADIPGVFEVELEGSGTLLTTLEVG
jgi:hypothetical protein